MAFCNLLKCYVACQLVSQLLFNIFISNNQIPFHLLSKKHLVRYLQVPKYYEHKCKFQKWHSWAVIILILFRSNYLINRTITKDRCLRFQAWIYQNVSNEFLSAWFKFRAKIPTHAGVCVKGEWQKYTRLFLPLSKNEVLKDIGHSISIGNLTLDVSSVTVSCFIHYDTSLQNVTDIITKCGC